jgi:hypothetical protein
MPDIALPGKFCAESCPSMFDCSELIALLEGRVGFTRDVCIVCEEEPRARLASRFDNELPVGGLFCAESPAIGSSTLGVEGLWVGEKPADDDIVPENIETIELLPFKDCAPREGSVPELMLELAWLGELSLAEEASGLFEASAWIVDPGASAGLLEAPEIAKVVADEGRTTRKEETTAALDCTGRAAADVDKPLEAGANVWPAEEILDTAELSC